VTHQEFLEQVDAYALGALDPEESRAVEAHLAAEGPHPECEAALARARNAVAALASDLRPVIPPPRVWDAIARSIGAAQVTPARRVPGWAMGLAAAAVLALLLGGGAQIREARRSAMQANAAAAECARDLADARIDVLRKDDALQLLVEPGTQLVSLKATAVAHGPLASTTGVVLFNARGRALFVGKSFASQTTQDYELWLIRDGKAVAAGLLPPGPDGKVLAEVRPELLAGARPAAFAVSLEKKGGETDAPKGPVFLTGALAPP